MTALRRGSMWLAPVLLTGCNGVFWGNLGVLSVTVGIFLGTVFLSRSGTNRSASRSSGSSAVTTSPRAEPRTSTSRNS